MTVMQITNPDNQLVFLIPNNSMTIFLLVRRYRAHMGQRDTMSEELTTLAMSSATLFLVAATAWPFDRLLCLHLERFHLHSVWHVAVGLSVCNLLQFYAHLRCTLTKRQPMVARAAGCIPYVVAYDKV